MFSKIISILTGVILVVGLAEAGTGYKAPKRVTGFEPLPVFDGVTPPVVSALGPGDSLGYTFYDYGTNGSANRNLINFGDGQISFARMASVDSANDTRGCYYKFYDGASWTTGWTRVEALRRGWTCIDQIADAGGVEAITSHVYEVNVDAARGANVWSPTVLTCVEGTWPRLAIGNGLTFHAIGSSVPDAVGYHQSLDAGATWGCDMYLVTEPGAVPDADGYDLTADGDKVAFAVAGIGGDVVLLESADNGATWTETVIYDIDESGATEGDEPADGSCSLLYDSNENLHVAWGCYQFIGGAPVPARDAGIRHWSAATGVQEIAFANPDTSIVDPGGRDGNFASGPDITADASGNVVIVYTTFVDDQDIVGNYYEHVFATGSADGGTTWSASTDITPGSGFDGVFPSVSDLADANIHMVYMCDALAGNAIQATHGPVASAFMYLTVPVADLTTGVKEIHGVLPEAYNLEQNYPNPFNPTTNIRYSIPASSDVSLKVYNLVGEEVATLVNGHQDAGHYVADFDATNLANGTYFYTLKAGNFSETKKMLLIK